MSLIATENFSIACMESRKQSIVLFKKNYYDEIHHSDSETIACSSHCGWNNELNEFLPFQMYFYQGQIISDYYTPALVTVISAVHGMGQTFSSDLNQLLEQRRFLNEFSVCMAKK